VDIFADNFDLVTQPESPPAAPAAEVVVYDHDGFTATVKKADLNHWLLKGFVERFGHSDGAPTGEGG
jgi:hypothetical protein